ncbi:protein scribble homolog [Anopheles stephensi]|uniref:protein scribble homolog n=1 Tax=Anopheles stephensi TaxID=30069 RepID=UPI001658B14C|nr:protein scribble homolog [Anopheles stephensi]XP_035915675.1 protein scribble homolog [Anopheles stephensi]XP_035915676.1 protein scribble homolog [Anopheles stephensi]
MQPVYAVLLLLVSLTPSPPTAAFQFTCAEMLCTITRWTPKEEGTFLLAHIPEKTVILKFVNLKSYLFNYEVLRNATRNGITVQILRSPVHRALMPASINVVFTKLAQTYLRDILFERGNVMLESLSIIESRLKSVPATIVHLTVVRHIEITQAFIEALNLNLLSKLLHLEELNFCNNKIRHLNVAVKSDEDFPNLKVIYLASNQLTTLNLHSFNGMRLLQTLDFRKNRITRAEGPLVSDSLRSIILSGNRIKAMSCCGWNLTSLTSFEINGNLLSWLPTCVEEAFPNIDYLSFKSNALEDINVGQSVITMKYVRNIDLGYNRLTSAVFSGVSLSLLMLNLENNRITKLSVPVAGYGLKIIVSCNAIEQFDLKSLSPNVTHLQMSHNPIDCSFDKALMLSDEEIECVRTETNTTEAIKR